MTPDTALVALVLYLVGCAAVFGWRSWRQRRETGSAGFHGISGTPGSAGWWGGLLFMAALVVAGFAPVLELVTVTVRAVSGWVPFVGLIIVALGFTGMVLAQTAMGQSWRIGVDATERTGVVTTGVFAVVRNPILTAMATTLVGLALMVPSLVAYSPSPRSSRPCSSRSASSRRPTCWPSTGRPIPGTPRIGRFVPAVGRLRPHAVKEIPA